ncbi:tRNA (adenosine(37)-N6)-dimethylallyltransferase MiaA [Olsenella uli]|uniref:tRNA (adenosine(37)-N6)-dimethylallyltransferase MiaA n=1 Tax=Olsenella uli TaxID=133926 RepID=UPI00195CD059|nr:tRNA (adenosine(37)-N6)-dimethylallyltransferase MiaA [Olsenella uli]MBM6676776.1 tRNA (adenosine(37)-N6)-dimethylallyltransferase MiaA [Olsenella uli]
MSGRGAVVCVVGPTASGKSALADLVAERLGSPVVSVDAMQVYRGMDVGTAKTPPAERRAELLMVDVADPLEDYSVRLFQRDARACIDAALGEGRVPVLCGGTGLYLNAVIDEMEFPAGEKGGASRERYERIARERGAEALHALLAERDPESAALVHANNVRRVVRALEMLDEGVSYARHHEGLHARAPHYDARLWGLTMSRERLYARIDARVDDMMAQGLLDEVRALAARGLTRELSAGQAIGYKELLAALDGETSVDEAVELIKRRSRRYAKRQLSWFRHDGRVCWIDLDETSVGEAARLVVGDAGEATRGTL